MPKPIRSKLVKALKFKAADEDHRQMTIKEVADEIENVRMDLWRLTDRLDKLSWALMTRGIKPGRIRETSEDIPF